MEHDQQQVKAKQYQRSQLRLGMIEEICTVIFLLIWVALAPHVVALLTGLGRYALLIVVSGAMYLSYQIALFILDYLGDYRLEHKYGLSTETLARWLWRHTKMITLSGLLLGVLLVGLYTALWYLQYWYVWCWIGWIVLSIVFTQIFPVVILPLFYPAESLEDGDLLERFRRLSEGTGISVQGVYSLELSKSTRKGNAMLAGLGRTRRVLLGDTLLEKLNPEQLQVVYAHELGHHVHQHFRKMLILHGAGSLILVGLLYLILNDFSGRGADYTEAVVRVPVVALAMTLFAFISRPVFYAFSRHFERQSDRYALTRTENLLDFTKTFKLLSEQNLADPDPPRWAVVLYYDHPPIHERIALAEKWSRETS